MSLPPQASFQIPDETQRVARAAFPKGTLCLRIADGLGAIYQNQEFAPLFPTRGQPAEAPARLALATVLQFVEGLSDRRAAEAVRGRIDWKYALGLELTDSGFDHTVLSEFRTRLVQGKAEQTLLDTLLTRVQELGLLKRRGRQRTDSTHVLAAVRMLNRLERVGETLRATLNALAVVAPEWLRKVAKPQWFERYGSRVENYDLPKTDAARKELAQQIGADGQYLLHVIDTATEQTWLLKVPAVVILRQVWAEQYIEEGEVLRWREGKEILAAAEQLTSPYDTDARYSTKRDIEWIGYKVHLTETCDTKTPHLIVNVETTPATTPDDHMAAVVHESLKTRNLLPREHLVDKGYTDSQMLVDSEREYGVTIIGPVAADPCWQAREGTGFDKSQFVVDWERQTVTCPAGKQSISWHRHTYPASGMAFEARFARQDCTPCASRSRCTRAKIEPRSIGLQTREQFEALQSARKRQITAEFSQQYAARSGIEATHEQALRRCGLRQSRYIGLAKTHLQHLITATAVNLVRLSDWYAGLSPAPTRHSRFSSLQYA
jgi:transposase